MFRKRNLYLIGGQLLALIWLLVQDPDKGSLTATFAGSLTIPIIAVWFAHLVRKALFDYLDMGELFENAKKSSMGSGLVFIGVCIVLFGLLGLFGNQARAQDVTKYIPQQAYEHVYLVKKEQERLWIDHPKLG